jgi:pimeloyl-ACP methyl ester carboxylesterase
VTTVESFVAWVQVDGDGPGMVLTHGAGDGSAHWDRLLPYLVHFRVVRWDLPGHGCSPQLADPAGYDRALCLSALADQVGVAGAPAVLVGHSYGGYLGLAHAILHPADVSHLVLVATGPGFRSEASRQRWNRGVEAYSARLGFPAAGLARQDDSLVLERLGEIRVPVLQVCGEYDTQFHSGLEVVAATLSDVTTVIVPGAGHDVAVTHTEAVVEAMLAFLGRDG